MKIQGTFCLNRLEWQSLGLTFSFIFIFKKPFEGPFTLTPLKEISSITSHDPLTC